MGEGLGMISRSRGQASCNGVVYGGVALLWKESVGSFKRIRIDRDDRFELLACARSIRGHRRKCVAIVCYLPPNLNKRDAEEGMECVINAVVDLKRKYIAPPSS